ncbi:MAG TPA: PAS domain-containing protein [Sphingomicrobium sp.]|nr:PAS domain-containing protein [Sphingomicrobium sp.]
MTDSEKDWLLSEARKIASALAETLSPLCEVVVHDLSDPAHTIVYIANNLSGRSVGDSATELGLARMADPAFPDVIANYANTFPDGRPAKSTSIGLKDRSGKFIAAICLNLDLSYLRGISSYVDALARTRSNETGIEEHLSGARSGALEAKVLDFAAARNRDPRALSSDDKRALIRKLAADGDLEIRGAADRIGALVGLSRSNVYYYLKAARG